ncbi:hypothetical protein BGZ73_002209 [Actinomortierella ambigua]|nr:hypothetical protein BGZ73_002209 [Actinomortierella ambigua]
MLHLFHLPEVTSIIASHLDVRARKACALVSKDWHYSWQPAVWETLNISRSHLRTRLHREECFHKGLSAMLDCVHKNAHWVRHLRLSLFDDAFYNRGIFLRLTLIWTQRYTNLETFEAEVLHADDWELCKTIIRVNRHLTSAILRYNYQTARCQKIATDQHMNRALIMSPSDASSSFALSPWGATRQDGSSDYHFRLRKLSLGCAMAAASLGRVLEACPTLEEIVVDNLIPLSDMEVVGPMELNWPWINGGDEHDQDEVSQEIVESETVTDADAPRPPPALPGLKTLILKGKFTDPELFGLLKRCSNLKRLVLNRLDEDMLHYLRVMPQPLELPHLTQLEFLADEPFVDFRYRSFSEMVFQAIPRHQLRQVTALVSLSLAVLIQTQSQSIEKVHTNIMRSPAASRVQIDKLLATCPRLKDVCIRFIHDGFVDIRKLVAKPWVCTGLEKLTLSIGLGRLFFDPNYDYITSTTQEMAAERLQVLKERKLALKPHQGTGDNKKKVDGREGGEIDDTVPESTLLQRLFMKRLAPLRQLRKIQILTTSNMYNGVGQVPLQWDIESGLGYLKDLALLKDLSLGGHWPVNEEVTTLQFMQQHWPNLEHVRWSFLESDNGAREWQRAHWPNLQISPLQDPHSLR